MARRDSNDGFYGAVAIAWMLGWPVAAGALAGYWLDGRFDSVPWATLGFSLGAMAVAIRRILQLVSPRAGSGGDGADS